MQSNKKGEDSTSKKASKGQIKTSKPENETKITGQKKTRTEIPRKKG